MFKNELFAKWILILNMARKGIFGIRDLAKTQCGIRETLTGYGIWLLPRKQDLPKFGHGFGIGKENDIRDSNDRSAGCGILVWEKEAGIRDPDLGDGKYPSSRLWEHTCLFESIIHSEQNESLNAGSLVFVLEKRWMVSHDELVGTMISRIYWVVQSSLFCGLLLNNNLSSNDKLNHNYALKHTLPTPRYGHYLTHAHNHITPTVAAMDSCFVLVRTYSMVKTDTCL